MDSWGDWKSWGTSRFILWHKNSSCYDNNQETPNQLPDKAAQNVFP